MSEDTTKTTQENTSSAAGAQSARESKPAPAHNRRSGDQPRVSRYGDPRESRGGRRPSSGGRRGRQGGRRGERPRPEFDQKILAIRRVTRVVAGGRRFSFSVTMAMGDRKGSIGVGVGKAGDTALAIDKALRDAKKSMVTVRLTETSSIPYDVKAKYTSSVVVLRPSPGKGVVAGSSVRTVLELAGIKDISGKILSRSKNRLNNARATLKALEPFSSPRKVDRGEKQDGAEKSGDDRGPRDRNRRAPRPAGPRRTETKSQ